MFSFRLIGLARLAKSLRVSSTAWTARVHCLAAPARVLLGLAVVASLAQAQGITRLVTTYGAIPNDGLDDTMALKSALSALQPSDTLLFNAAGTYQVGGPMGTPTVPPPGLLQLSGKADITITAVAGVTILLTGYDRNQPNKLYPDVLKVDNCTNFVIAGANPGAPLVFDTRGASSPVPGNEGLPFLQGKVVSVTSSTTGGPCWARIRVSDAEMLMPGTLQASNWGAWMVDAGRPTWAQYGGVVKPAGAAAGGIQLVDLTFTPQTWAQPFSHWTVNSDLVVTLNQSDTYCITLWGCQGTVVARDLLAYHLPGKWFSSGACGDLTVDNVDARPKNASRLLSVDRDGVNASGEKMVTRNCDIVLCGDDGIVSNGTALGRVVPGSVGNTFQAVPPGTISIWPTTVAPGQTIALLDSTLSFSAMEAARITAVSYSSGPGPRTATYTYNPAVTTPNFAANLAAASATNPYYTYNPSWSLSGAAVTNCTVSGARGVGVVVRSVYTSVTNCIIDNTLEVGLHAGGGLADAYPWWNAGAPPHYLAIDSCNLRRCGVPDTGLATRGAIEIAYASGWHLNPGYTPGVPWDPCQSWLEPDYSASADVIQDVSITNTVITDFHRAGIFAANVGGLRGLRVNDCTFANSGPLDTCHPEYGTAVTAWNCGLSGVVRNNVYTNCQQSFWQNATSNVTFIP